MSAAMSACRHHPGTRLELPGIAQGEALCLATRNPVEAGFYGIFRLESRLVFRGVYGVTIHGTAAN